MTHKNFQHEIKTDSEEFTAESDSESSFEDPDFIAYFQDLFSYDEIEPKRIMFQHDPPKRDPLHMIVEIIDMKLAAESNGNEQQSSEVKTPTDSVHSKIFAFEESANSDNKEPTRSHSPVPDIAEKALLLSEKKADFLHFEIRGTTLNTHFPEVLDGRILRKYFHEE